MCDGLDKFFTDLSELSKEDILQAYADALKPALRKTGRYFIDAKSRTLAGMIEAEGALWCVRLEGRGHRADVALIRKMRRWMQQARQETGMDVYVQTARRFYTDKARKLLRLTGFVFAEERDGYIISRFGGEYGGSGTYSGGDNGGGQRGKQHIQRP